MLVYKCVLVQILSAKSRVLSVNRLSSHLFPTVHMQSFCCGSPACHQCQFELKLNHFAFVNILCSFILMIPLSLRKSFALASYTLQFVYLYFRLLF